MPNRFLRTAAQPLVTSCIAFALLALVVVPTAYAQSDDEPRPSAVEGIVTDQEENPLKGVDVTITGADGFEFKTKTNRKGAFSARFDKGGGSFVVLLEKEGYDPYDVPLDVESGMAHEITIRLVEEGSNNTYYAVRSAQEGLAAYEAEDWATAREKFAQAVEEDPELPAPHLYLADLSLREEDYDAAAAEIETYLPHDPANEGALRVAFDIYHGKGDIERRDAIVASLTGSEIARAMATKIYNEGVGKSRSGHTTDALADFRLALALAPDLTAVYSGMTAVLFNNGSYVEAAEAAGKLLEAQPNNIQGRRMYYLALAATDDPATDAALDAWAEVAQPAVLKMLLDRGDDHFRDGRLAEATADFAKVVQLDPESADGHYKLGVAYNSGGDAANARLHLERFLELAPDHAEAEAAREILKYL